MFGTVLACSLAVALSQAPADPKGDEVTALVAKYLNLVKAKKWAEARKLVHPRTLEVIAEHKKRLGREDHPMAPQGYEKTESYLKDFKVTATHPGPQGTWVVETSEDNYQVEEKGVAEGEAASYLVGTLEGKTWVVDKKRGGEAFTKDAIKLGYKGYFDKPAPPPDTHDEER